MSLNLRVERITASRAHRDWLNTDEGLDAFGQGVRDSEMPGDSARDLLYIGKPCLVLLRVVLNWIAITQFDRRDEAWRASRMAHTSNTNNLIAEYTTGHSTVNPARHQNPSLNSTAAGAPSMGHQQQRNTAANDVHTSDVNQEDNDGLQQGGDNWENMLPCGQSFSRLILPAQSNASTEGDEYDEAAVPWAHPPVAQPPIHEYWWWHTQRGYS